MTVVKQVALLVALGLAMGGAFLVNAFMADETPAAEGAATAEPAPAPVVVEAVRYQGGAAVAEAVGTAESSEAVILHPESAGRVMEILFEAGQRVKQGQALLRLDSEAEKLAVELAKVRLQDARQQLARYQRAAPSGAVSATEVERAQTALSAARIELAQAELALNERTLSAPFNGVIGIPDVDIGERVTESSAIATLDDRSVILVDFQVPEAYAYGVGAGGAVEATAWALPGETFTGTVDSYASRIDPLTRTLRVRARLPNEADRLRAGMSFVVRLPLAGERHPSVPSVALQWDREGAYLWRVADGVAERVEAGVVKREGRWVLLDAPLAEGDVVVVEGVQRLRQGRRVEIVDAVRATSDGGADGV